MRKYRNWYLSHDEPLDPMAVVTQLEMMNDGAVIYTLGAAPGRDFSSLAVWEKFTSGKAGFFLLECIGEDE